MMAQDSTLVAILAALAVSTGVHGMLMTSSKGES
jgi:hypothetical protein